ncbi:hypothetical protein [Actinomadura sp. KC216]|uniref:hypothetical protein n=1 Tax=Actinomadura sp. KC216 TaxID=2530370 RepID=UPI001404276F|nr:hypothetical protein [Actinomadura sp. KC216]
MNMLSILSGLIRAQFHCGRGAEIVEYARRRHMTVHVIWPEGARRTGAPAA